MDTHISDAVVQMRPRHLLRLCSLWLSGIACCLTWPAHAGSSPPLTAAEQDAVVGEIRAMVKTDENRVNAFVVEHATPDRIERLFQSPEFLRQPTTIRENGLIFAGQGTLLTFDKPSDVIRKVASWFPQEVAAARKSSEQRFFGNVHLYGPFANWQAEPAAFLALWNCMPQSAWLRPGDNPFMRRMNDGLPLLAIGARSSSPGEYDFGFCVRERNGYRPGWSDDEQRINTEEMHATAEKVIPVLRDKFAHLLSSNRCKGTGPDDCVLVLRLWAELSPDDPALAQHTQALEADIAPDSELPDLLKPMDQYGPGGKEGEPRFDAALRQAAFLRAKLASVLNAPTAWDASELPATLHQMTQLRQKIDAAIDYRWSYYDLDYYNEAVNPWGIVATHIDTHPKLRQAVMAELRGLGDEVACTVFEPWLQRGGAALRSAYALQQWTHTRPLRCGSPDWAWLKEGKEEEAISQRERYLDFLDHGASGALRERMLNELTDTGASCFAPHEGGAADWLRKVCTTWISEPQQVPFRLPHSGLTLDRAEQFRMTALPMPPSPEGQDAAENPHPWLAGLLPGVSAAAAQRLQAFATDLRKANLPVTSAKIWRHPRHDTALLELELQRNEDTHMVLAITPQELTVVEVPARFRGRYNEIVRVSDLDDDGHLELWWAESFGRCQGDESDLEREIDCTAKTAEMGEAQGDVLSYFVNTDSASGKRPTAPFDAALTVDEPPSDDRTCNTILVGTVLADTLDLDFGGGELNGGRGDVIGVVCKPHPLHPEQTLVALFHDLKDAQHEYVEDRKGFVYAVIDVERKRVHRIYRDTIEEDASIRVSDFSLQIDTARYNLAPGVRALGVRMNIGYSPRCAEGGESNYLTLFVEDGATLKPVLKNLPMSLWSITSGSNDCGDGDADYTVDNVTLTLRISDTVTEGWHDLELVAHHGIETTHADAEAPLTQEAKTQVLGKLRAKDKSYPTESVRSRLWP